MPGLRDLLDRFRPAGAPGGAARPGVPADRAAELSAELEPVLALLADVEAEAEHIRHDAADRAEACRRRAGERVESTLADARARAEAARSGAAARARAAADAESARTAAESARAVGLLRDRVSARMPAYVERATARALADLAGPEHAMSAPSAEASR